MVTSEELEIKYFPELKLKNEQILQVQKKSKELLQEIHNLCEENGLRYSIAYGTMLGAIRHKGFIPWDDDIDIVMPRKDYNKLAKIIEKNSNLIWVSTENYKNYPRDFVKVIYKNTILKHLFMDADYPSGIFVDIFPMDYLNKNIFIAKIQQVNYRILHLLASFSSDYKFPDKIILEKAKKEKEVKINYKIRRFIGFFTSILPIKIWIKLSRKGLIKNKPSNYYCDGIPAEIISVEMFQKLKKYKFDDLEFWGFEDYDKYLTQAYGNYMQIPEESHRIGHYVSKLKL